MRSIGAVLSGSLQVAYTSKWRRNTEIRRFETYISMIRRIWYFNDTMQHRNQCLIRPAFQLVPGGNGHAEMGVSTTLHSAGRIQSSTQQSSSAWIGMAGRP